ncbi:hypothetical protein HJC23_006979 [Cyclotella cryptica]|uniref:UDP-glucose:glycoprotein glucosyltransferase n=1 Tax=Cyclotella cryptica TaxID=29204 RepID=A0ABD3QLR8_9STRA|eukprot:CCRYP_004305-RA/>CCRYP_004305-RA protein AED:0.01 eAED:0.01 QI:85/1/1/1/1/1/3/230/1845
MKSSRTASPTFVILLLLLTLSTCLINIHASDQQEQTSSPTLRRLSSFQQSYTHLIPSDQAVIRHGRRDIEASVKAHGWPSTIFSPLCEAWAYFEAGGSIGKSKDDTSNNNVRDNVSNEASWRYLDALVEKGGIPALDAWIGDSNNVDPDGSSNGDSSWTYANSTKLAIQSAKSSSGSLDENLLPLALALRAHMPHCEMHRSLARDVAIHFGLYNVVARAEPPAAFCVLSRVSTEKDDEKQTVLWDTKVLADAALLPPALKVLEGVKIKQNEMEVNYASLLMPLPEESYHPDITRKNIDDDDFMFEEEDAEVKKGPEETVAILYGQVGTTAFASFYKALMESKVKFVVRHMGHIAYEEEMQASEQHGHGTLSSTQSLASRAIPTALQGYGVRLDIRNVEYKAFDDGPNDKAKDGDSEQSQPDWNDSEHHPDHPARNEYLAGINLKTIMERLDAEADTDAPLPKDLQALQTALLQSHPAQLSSESIVPPAWKRRSLSLQAATVIAYSSDPLETLKGISQNLPSIAHSLSSVSVAESLKTLAEEATDVAAKVGAVSPGWGDAAFGFYVNSREVNVERPSFNVFQLLDVLREEDKKLRDLEGTVRPMLEKTMGVLMGEGRGKGKAFNILKTIRKGMDMGVEKLVRFGKKKSEALVTDQDNEDYDEDEAETSGSSTKKYRIDVGRGGKKAVLYLNDLEKDPEYRSWPNVEEMMMRMQFGQGPTVRRNLFTMLIVLDPASGNVHPAINVLPHLVNSQFPLRIGLLVVSRQDATQKKPSKPGPWNSGNRPFHARDSLILMRHISKRYGGMAAMSCLINVFQPHSEESPSVGDYIHNHVSLLSQIGVFPEDEEADVRQEMELLLKSPPIDDGYEDAFEFATQKMISPGMSFFNGIPFPDASESAFGLGVNEVLRYEQQHVMSLVMQGAITDSKPRSVYANLLSGDNCYKQYHPALRGSEVEYAPMLTNVNDLSLIFPSTNNPVDIRNVDAFFVVEAVLNFDTIDGVNAALNFFDLMQSAPARWHSSKTVSVAFRIVSNPRNGGVNGDPSKASGYASLFCLASRFNIKTLKRAFEIMHENKSFLDAWNSFRTSDEFDEETSQNLVDAVSKMPRCSNEGTLDKDNYYTINGRVYPIEGPFGPFLNEEDIKMLLSVEMDRSIGMTRLISPKFLAEPGKVDKSTDESTILAVHNAIVLSATALNHVFSTSAAAKSTPSSRDSFSGIVEVMDSLGSSRERNPLYFSWNEESAKKRLQVEISVICDPLTEPTQRVAPLLLTIRDSLKLPLRLMIAPRQVVENDLPLSSYYRFAIDPLALPDKNPPTALFSNLPSNHLLTVRMDVPEPWDLQQAFAVQDADNLRCDARYGCGDEAYLLAKAGGEVPEGSLAPNGRIELTQMEYTLKSLLFFGQCYDSSTNSPPNGLQLTLDRSKLKGSSLSHAVGEVQVESDGSTFGTVRGDGPESPTSPHDHTDTLVMKTVGYWQLRANPGIWNLQIEKNSRGAEIYHMVDGSVSQSGRLSVSNNASEFISKSLVMKDFSNHGQILLVKRNKGHETSKLFPEDSNLEATHNEGNEVVHVFSLATGHAYERLLKIMMLSVTKRTKSPVKFWFFENFLSPSFKSSALYMAERIGCQLEFVTYKWPEWLRGQSEKQRLIWGYKILFLDVLFPLDVKKIIYVDADQVVRGDMTELWNLDLEGAPYGYTPFCDSREETLGYQFWRSGFWKNHLRGKPYHISALYVVDLERFRRELVGDKLRATYQQLSADPNSLANLDQDLPNYAQHDVRIFSLPQKWLWCESWCSDETKAEAMTIDLCNNPLHKEAKISMAKRIISGELFEESWEELDAEVERYYQDFLTLRQ